jgi:hypothetical protein
MLAPVQGSPEFDSCFIGWHTYAQCSQSALFGRESADCEANKNTVPHPKVCEFEDVEEREAESAPGFKG